MRSLQRMRSNNSDRIQCFLIISWTPFFYVFVYPIFSLSFLIISKAGISKTPFFYVFVYPIFSLPFIISKAGINALLKQITIPVVIHLSDDLMFRRMVTKGIHENKYKIINIYLYLSMESDVK
jgi:hypothetical protein